MAHKALQLFNSTATTGADTRTLRIDNEYGSAIDLIVQINAISSAASTDSVQVALLGLVPGTTSNPYTIIQSSVITGTGVFVVRAGIGLSTASTSVAVNAPTPKDMAATLTFSTTNAGFSARVGAHLIQGT